MEYKNSSQDNKIVKELLGAEAELFSITGKRTEDFFVELGDFAEYLDVDYVIQILKEKYDISIYSGIKIYDNEKAKKYARFKFQGNVIVIEGLDIQGQYCFLSGRPFKKPVGEGWFREKKDRKKFWIKNNSTESEKFCALIDVIERDIGQLQSFRYALYIYNGKMSIFFWEPEMYIFPMQVEIYADILKLLCQ